MSEAPPETPLPFKYIGGDPSLDLVNTVDWEENGLKDERMTDYDRMTRWAEGAGILGERDAKRLRKAAAAQPREARAAYEEALRLRGVLQAVFEDVAAGKRTGKVWDEFNALLAGALQHLRIVPVRGEARAEWDWQGREDRLESPLWPVLWAAARLLASEEAGRLRICASPGCGWMYVDRSRNGLRRWCQMESCGTRAKSQRRAERSRR